MSRNPDKTPFFAFSTACLPMLLALFTEVCRELKNGARDNVIHDLLDLPLSDAPKLSVSKFVALSLLTLCLTAIICVSLLGASGSNADILHTFVVHVPVVIWPLWALVSLLITLMAPNLAFYVPDVSRHWTIMIGVLAGLNFLVAIAVPMLIVY